MHAEDVVLLTVTRVPLLRTAEPKQVLPKGEPQVAPLWLSIQADLSGVIVMCCVALLEHLWHRKVRRVLDAVLRRLVRSQCKDVASLQQPNR